VIPRPSPERAAAWLATIVGLAAILLAQFPHVQAWRANRLGHYPHKVYTGAVTTGAEDTMTYWGWMEQARGGHFFFTDLYTPEQTPRNYVNVFFWLLGVIARATGRSVGLIYAAARPLAGAIALVVLWRFLGAVFDKPWERFACYLLALFPGGWEGLACFLERNHGFAHVSSPGWWIPEMNTFFSLMVFPHFLAGFAIMLGIASMMLKAWADEARRSRHAVAAGALLALLTFVHPYDTVTMLGVVWSAPAVLALAERRIPRREISVTLVATGVFAPAFVYNWIVFRSNPAMKAWDLQNLMDTPDFDRLAIAFGISGLLAATAWFGIARMSRAQLLMAAWLASTLILIQLPVRFQRRMLGGVQFPIAVLAVFTLSTWIVPAIAQRLRLTRWSAAGAVLVVVLVMAPLQGLTPYYLMDLEKRYVRAVKYPSWINRTEASALGYIRANTPADARVLASYDMGNLMPVFGGRRAVLGHYALTIDANEKHEEIRRFFDSAAADDDWRRQLMRRYEAEWLLWTERERALGDWDPSAAPWLEEIEREGEGEDIAVLFRVRPEAGGS
jgi:hypothetical protein